MAADITPIFLGGSPPGLLSVDGVTFYGVLDAGFAYQNSGLHIGRGDTWGLNYNVAQSQPGQREIWSPTYNALDVTSLGIKVDEKLGGGWHFIGRVESGIDPFYLGFDDACHGIQLNNGKPYTQQSVAGDSSRCGQVINGQGFGGFSNPTYGAITIGRQNALNLSTLASYDPAEVSAAYSTFGVFGSLSSGSGAVEASKWDNSLKYMVQRGPVHAAFMLALGSNDSALHATSYAGNVGVTLGNFSLDGVYTSANSEIRSSLYGTGACGVTGKPSCKSLNVTGQDGDGWLIAAKYVIGLGTSRRHPKASPRVVLSAGYESIILSDPTNTLSLGQTTVGGYSFGQVNNTAYLYGQRHYLIEWAGAKIADGAWSGALAYYHLSQPYYATSATSAKCASTATSNCTGEVNTVSGLVDDAINKYVDLYGGVIWSDVDGGFASGFKTKHTTTIDTGIRLRL